MSDQSNLDAIEVHDPAILAGARAVLMPAAPARRCRMP